MVRKSLVLIGWFTVTFIMLVVNLTMLISYAESGYPSHKLDASLPANTNFQLTAAGGTSEILDATVIAGDARVLLVKAFMNKYQSPLAQYADTMVSDADKYGFDFRLLPAIGMCESNLGVHIPSHDSFNAWGVAVYTGQLSGKKFENWPTAIDWVSKYIKSNYYDRGFTTLRDIGAIWAPPSVNNNYSWSNCVQGFMDSIQ